MTERDQIVLSVIGLAVVIAGFWFLALKPVRAENTKIEAEIAAEVETRDELMATVRNGQQARTTFAEDYADTARLGRAVPQDDQTPSLLYQLESAARAHDINFREMELEAGSTGAATPASVPGTQAAAAVAPPGTRVGPAGFPTMPFAFNFEGNFFDMERFLAQIERYTTTSGTPGDIAVRGRLLTVDGVRIGAAVSGFPDVQASVSATAYVLPADEGLTAGAAPGGPAGPDSTPTQTANGSGSSPTPTASAAGVTP